MPLPPIATARGFAAQFFNEKDKYRLDSLVYLSYNRLFFYETVGAA
jgi:hypothetical protein